MSFTETKLPEANCQSEYTKLERVVLCEPAHMEIKEVINNVQEKYKHQNIDQSIAQSQHLKFKRVLENNDVDVIHLEAHEKYPEQVFTRDIGFVIGKNIFVSEMANKVRSGEEQVLEKWLKSMDMNHYKLTGNKVEGGDVIIDERTVYIGMGSRTCMEAVEEIQRQLPTYTIVPIKFNDKYLHLDCIFNILSSEIALIYPPAFDADSLKQLAERYHLVAVSEDEQFSMGTNVLSIGNNKVISLPQNKTVNKSMQSLGFEVIEVDFSEIIKSGGSFRCCSMPIKRS